MCFTARSYLVPSPYFLPPYSLVDNSRNSIDDVSTRDCLEPDLDRDEEGLSGVGHTWRQLLTRFI